MMEASKTKKRSQDNFVEGCSPPKKSKQDCRFSAQVNPSELTWDNGATGNLSNRIFKGLHFCCSRLPGSFCSFHMSKAMETWTLKKG